MAFNKKGQSFSTFKLLISAIVAVAILAILFGILDIIPSPWDYGPMDVAPQALSKAVDQRRKN